MVKNLEKNQGLLGNRNYSTYKNYLLINMNRILSSQEVEEVFHTGNPEDEQNAKNLCDSFKDKYDKELKYRFENNFYYFSYA
ncbi:MAG: hypothetical protein WC812_02145 [Candidatus Pacearchaeota archaeon]|jgi:hypothetical protein